MAAGGAIFHQKRRSLWRLRERLRRSRCSVQEQADAVLAAVHKEEQYWARLDREQQFHATTLVIDKLRQVGRGLASGAGMRALWNALGGDGKAQSGRSWRQRAADLGG
jgi:hypothetical protein